MTNLSPTILYTVSMMFMLWGMLLTLLDYSTIIEWKMCFMFSVSIKFELMMEWSSMLYSSIVLFISSNVMKFSKEYMKKDQNNLRFIQIVLMFIMSMNMLIYIPNLLCLLIGWDGLGITSFILVIYYNNSRSLSAGMLTIMTNRLGDVFLLMSVIITLTMGDWLLIFHLMDNKFFTYQWLGIMIAAMTKSAQMPFSAWLPAAMAAPTPVSALVHSSTLVTAGIFIMYRFNIMILHSKTMQLIILVTSMLTIFSAGVSAMYENDMKKIIALSTLSQLGLMAMPLAINMPMLSFFHMFAHAMFKALLFIAAGTLISENMHTQDLRLYGSFNNWSPLSSSAMLISSTALMGIPFMTGYYSKHSIMLWSSYMLINTTIYLLLLYMIFLTSMYSTRLLIFLLTTQMKSVPSKNQKSWSNNNIPMLIMSMMSIWTGSIFQWLTPIKEVNKTIDDSVKTMIPSMVLMMMMLILPMWVTKLNLNKLIHSNKMFSSISFMSPLSSQFMLPAYLNMSLFYYKYLDQSWLENISTLGPSYSLMNLSSQTNLLLAKGPQNILFLSMKSSIFFMTIMWILYM